VSVFRPVPLQCPVCGAAQTVTLAVSLNGPRVPEILDEIRCGSFHHITCPECAADYYADGPLIYIDFERKRWIGEFPHAWECSWATLEQQPLASFRRAMIDMAPPFLRDESAGFTIRTVFGLDALAEKIAVLDAGLDDRAIEIVKLAALLRTTTPLHPSQRPRFVRRDEDAILLRLGGDDRDDVLRVPVDVIDEVVRDTTWKLLTQELADAQYVDIGRLMVDGRGRLPESAYA
jgi:predicted nucleic-acid-binding Zn-ribbon protein